MSDETKVTVAAVQENVRQKRELFSFQKDEMK